MEILVKSLTSIIAQDIFVSVDTTEHIEMRRGTWYFDKGDKIGSILKRA
jgi:hypothetical protein